MGRENRGWASGRYSSLLSTSSSVCPPSGRLKDLYLSSLLSGFVWTLVFFKQVVIEQIALSFGLSIAVVAFSIITLNVLFDIRITGFNSLLIIIVIVIIPLVLYYLKRFIKRQFVG